MDLSTIALLLGAAGVGGAVGAAASAVVAGNRVASAFSYFEAIFLAFFEGREDPESLRVRSSFASVKDAIAGMGGALGKLKRALRIK